VVAEKLALVQVLMAAGLIVIGGLVEGYGYGLSLGTRWPYTRNIVGLAARGDPEAWHRLLATLLGVNAVILWGLHPGSLETAGFVLIAFTALLGMATLYVLAGKAPAVFQGLHGLLAYATLVVYLLIAYPKGSNPGAYLATSGPLHSFFLVIFMGGVVTGQRGFQRPIGVFTFPRTLAHWVWTVHGLSVLLFLLTLAYFMPVYNVAFLLALGQLALGFLIYQAVNAQPERPGFLVPLHQLLAVGIVLGLLLGWRVPVPFLG